jgi:parvulin-like peptidyl-prolyl isomerase
MLGCGGAASPAKSADGNQTEDRTTQCLRDAAAPREPKANAPESITVSHVLVRHRDLERPLGAKRTRGEACLRALDALERLKAGLDWAAAVKQFSDAPGPDDGSLGKVTREQLDPAFASAAFALDVEELSYVVESPRGYHVILRRD